MGCHADSREPIQAEAWNLVGVTATLVAISRFSTPHARPCKYPSRKGICKEQLFKSCKEHWGCRLLQQRIMNTWVQKSLSSPNHAAMDNVVLPVSRSAVAPSCWHTATHGMQWLLLRYTQSGLHYDLMSHASAQHHARGLLAAQTQPKHNIAAQSEHLGLWVIIQTPCHKVLMTWTQLVHVCAAWRLYIFALNCNKTAAAVYIPEL